MMKHAAFCTSLMFAAAVASACECPPQADSKDLVIATSRYVVCGYTDATEEKAVKASELELFECGRAEPLLQFGALQTARIERDGDDLRITEVGKWPWGPNWESIEVPEARWSIVGGHAESVSILP